MGISDITSLIVNRDKLIAFVKQRPKTTITIVATALAIYFRQQLFKWLLSALCWLEHTITFTVSVWVLFVIAAVPIALAAAVLKLLMQRTIPQENSDKTISVRNYREEGV